MMSVQAKKAVLQGQNALVRLNPAQPHNFAVPIKKINEGQDVPHFLTSQAYRDIRIFILQLNLAVCPRKLPGSNEVHTYALDSGVQFGEPVRRLQELLRAIESIIEDAPPDPGPRRFGNISFRRWHEILEDRIHKLLTQFLPQKVLDFPAVSGGSSVIEEILPYLLGGFGSSQRLDYGTGHELSFMAFLGCLWKLGAFSDEESVDGSLEREIVIGVVEPYLRVIRKLILTYTLEPAGSHGVWGLDDHSFVSYIFGSSQFCPPINGNDPMPEAGALPGAPNPGDIVKQNIVDKERHHNMYFSAIGFINDVKTGPFWEHSRQLYDISGIRDGWGKINKGMIKMYNGEVLSKFPVVQHFPFGSLFSWELDPDAVPPLNSVHTSSQPQRSEPSKAPSSTIETTRAPWASNPAGTNQTPNQIPTQAPWARQNVPPARAELPTRAPWVAQPPQPNRGEVPPTRAPWATAAPKMEEKPIKEEETKAPWAKQ